MSSIEPQSANGESTPTVESLLEEVALLKKELSKAKRNRADERTGRTTAEKELRRLLQERDPTGLNGGLKPIGYFKSCFQNRRGTPRQACVAPNSLGRLVLEPYVQPKDSLCHLEEFSHVWVIWVFHENTNSVKQSKNAGQNQMHVKAKIHPPRLNGQKVGLFSTRTPHRPNPIGLSLMKIERIDLKSNSIYLRGVDVIQGTPVLDIKPFIPYCDSVPSNELRFPSWVEEEALFSNILITRQAIDQINDLIQRRKGKTLFEKSHDVILLFREVLSHDIRSLHRRKMTKLETSEEEGETESVETFHVNVDLFSASYIVSTNDVVRNRYASSQECIATSTLLSSSSPSPSSSSSSSSSSSGQEEKEDESLSSGDEKAVLILEVKEAPKQSNLE